MMSIEERISLNKLEYIDLLRNYFENVFYALLNGKCNYNNILYLVSKLKEYKIELQDETEYLKYLLLHTNSIKEEELLRVLELIDDNNKETFLHFDSIGDNYSDSLYNNTAFRYSDRLSLSNNYNITDEIKGVTLNRNDINKYFEEYITYKVLQGRNTKVIDFGNDLSFYGAFPVISDNRIRGVRLIIPPVKNLKTALVNVHEFKHGIDIMEQFGLPMDETIDYEARAKNEEQRFIEHYVRNK